MRGASSARPPVAPAWGDTWASSVTANAPSPPLTATSKADGQSEGGSLSLQCLGCRRVRSGGSHCRPGSVVIILLYTGDDKTRTPAAHNNFLFLAPLPHAIAALFKSPSPFQFRTQAAHNVLTGRMTVAHAQRCRSTYIPFRAHIPCTERTILQSICLLSDTSSSR